MFNYRKLKNSNKKILTMHNLNKIKMNTLKKLIKTFSK